MSEPALRVVDLTVRYEGSSSLALAGVTFELAPGERVALVGQNGSGKTSLLTAIVGLTPGDGEITVAGTPVERRRLDEVRNKVGFLFSVADDQILFPTVRDDVLFGLQRSGTDRKSARSKVEEVLRELGIESLAEATVHQLSLGQRKRVALAGTLVLEPPLLLLDEPSSGLDPRGRIELADALEQLDSALLLATHDLEFAQRTCTRALVLRGGELIADLDLEALAGEDISQRLFEAMYDSGLGSLLR